ncbi:hypothetical protein GCM10007216_17890 [Thalassobacillus devorans]|uniref:Uncharacterized protein n=1 Tax=Thalassobacillus devorans TaxID=279813 RepID=A0ABQ1P2E2_9BACI|nr:hypothetical protein [Thalassobacillus devorans]NIK28267.1 selenocysteine-specific translation elongation factor [Thalassobacillus devorans]GGC87584.1 hypothetical protein GCM10007216_17890 [Thalassobacillus devorans]
MGVSSKLQQKGVSRRQFEHSLLEMMDDMQRLEQKISLKADEVVFTMAVAHRKEIDRLQEEILTMREEIKELKKNQKDLHMDQSFSLAGRKTRLI